jgi:hypothetical protein
VRLIVERSSTQIWAELHERAFRRLDGSVRVVVLPSGGPELTRVARAQDRPLVQEEEGHVEPRGGCNSEYEAAGSASSMAKSR